MKSLFVFLLTVFVWTGAGPAESAPLPPMQPMTIEGTIVNVAWSPVRQLKGIPGLSGTAGTDRTMPARYIVTLSDVTMEGREEDKGMMVKDGGRVEILLNHDRDDGFLKKGMRIEVMGYQERGDEGGTWTAFERIDIKGKR